MKDIAPKSHEVTGRDLSLLIQISPRILIIAIPVRRIIHDILPSFACFPF